MISHPIVVGQQRADLVPIKPSTEKARLDIGRLNICMYV